MKFNQPINRKIPLIKAVRGKEFKKATNGNVTTFTFPKNSLNFDTFREICKVLHQFKERSITFDLSSFLDAIEPECMFSAATALLIKINAFNEMSFTCKTKCDKYEANVLVKKTDMKYVDNIMKVVHGVHLARNYQIMPVNFLGIEGFADQITKIFQSFNNKNVRVRVLEASDIEKEQMGLLQAVNKGSDEPAKMIVIEYFNAPRNKDTLVYIGKGVMFDAGGYELKPNQYMDEMNQDMTGAATVFATLYGLVATEQKCNVVGILPLAKNLINEKSMLVNDVYKACNGRTVEILAPDAEGRLILADAIAYANKYYNPTKVFTIATLTGLSHLAFGDYMTPCWATKDETAKKIIEISKMSLEHILPMPYYTDFFTSVNNSSKIADCANSCKGEREASNATAAAFLKLFNDKCDDFVHFDIAGTNLFKKFSVNPLALTLMLFATSHFFKK